MDKNQEVSLVAACVDYFGKLDGQGLGQFREEYQKLTTADKEEIKLGLIAEGYKIKA